MPTITLGNVTIDRDRFEVWVGDHRVDLTFVEFELVYQLARNASRVIARPRLMQAVWGKSPEGCDDRKLTVHMSRLRKKMRGSSPWRIETYTKRGYAFTDHGSAESSPGGEEGGLRGSHSARVLALMTEAAPMER